MQTAQAARVQQRRALRQAQLRHRLERPPVQSPEAKWKRLAAWAVSVLENRWDETRRPLDIGYVDHMIRYCLPGMPHRRYSRQSTNMIELAWLAQQSIVASAEDRELQAERVRYGVVAIGKPMLLEWMLPTHGFHAFNSLTEFTEMEKRVALELENHHSPELLQEAAHLFCWLNYIIARVGDIYQPLELPFGHTHAVVERARAFLDAKLVAKQLPDLVYSNSRPLLRGSFQGLASFWRYERQHPSQIGYVVRSRVLKEFLDRSETVRTEFVAQSNLDPSDEGALANLTARAREQWYLALFCYSFDQGIQKQGNTISFRTHYVIHWSDWGTEKAHKLLTTNRRMGRPALPLLLHLGIGWWAVWDPVTTLTRFIVRDVVHALTLWMYVVVTAADNKLENGRVIPDLGWGVKALAEERVAHPATIPPTREAVAQAEADATATPMDVDVGQSPVDEAMTPSSAATPSPVPRRRPSPGDEDDEREEEHWP